MDLRVGSTPRPQTLDGRGESLRAAIGQVVGQAREQARDKAKDQAPRAEAVLARWIERTRPAWSWLVLEWRRLGTAAAIILTVGLLLHAMYGANGMVVYRQKRAEMQALQSEVDRLQRENNQQAEEIRSLKSDPAAIEKEAREQLRYARPGEIILVAPETPHKPATGKAQKQ